MSLSTSVVIVTYNRPDCLRRCVECLISQEPSPHQIIVVDTSPDDSTQKVVLNFPQVTYIRAQHGYGHMTASRNLGLKAVTGNVIAFMDDDAFAHPEWLTNLQASYDSLSVGAVGGRALNNQPYEERLGINEIGRLKENGTLTGYFAANPGKTIEVDHIIGCNMSFRRDILAQLGGLREDYTGTEVREETDICLRVKALGYRVLFNPAACVDHIGAPQAKGKRFDARYDFYAQRNHIVLLLRNFGPGAGILWRYLGFSIIQSTFDFAKRVIGAFGRVGVGIGGTAVGILAGAVLLVRNGKNPIRHDSEGKAIQAALQTEEPHSEIINANLLQEQPTA